MGKGGRRQMCREWAVGWCAAKLRLRKSSNKGYQAVQVAAVWQLPAARAAAIHAAERGAGVVMAAAAAVTASHVVQQQR